MNKYIQNKISTYFNTGMRKSDTTEDLRKLYLLNIINIIAIFFLFTFGIKALLNDTYTLGYTLLSLTFILVINYFFLKLSDYRYKKEVASYVISILFFLLMLYLIYTGGVENTGPLWIFPLPVIILFLLEFKHGLITMFLFLVLISFILFGLDVTSYSEAFKERIILSLLLVTFLASVYEYLRDKSFRTMHALSQRLEEASETDILTKIYNRRGIHKELENLCKQYKLDNKNFSILLCDIDYFKKINDNYGHIAGDEVLKKVSTEIQNMLRKEDILGRWGGEEFIIVLPHISYADAYTMAEKIRTSIQDTSFKYNEHMIAMTVSIGVAENEDGLTIDDVIVKADDNMYRAKKEGRNTVFPQTMKQVSLSLS